MNIDDDVTIVIGGELHRGRVWSMGVEEAFTVAIGPHHSLLRFREEGVRWLRGKWNRWDSRGRALLTAYTLAS